MTKSRIVVGLVLLSYVFFTLMYMGPSVWDCKNTVYGFGDNTAGPIWRYQLEPKQSPIGGYQNQTNYPVGETQYSPTNYSLIGQSTLIWGTSRAFGPICGYNVVNILGFIASAAVMFGFILALTGNVWIAWLAGYAVSFSPYYQMKVGGHPGYGYQALLIGCAWAFFNLLKRRRRRDAVILSAVAAVTFYFDPYFSLLGSLTLGTLGVGWAAASWWRTKTDKKQKQVVVLQFKQLLFAAALLVAFLLPLVGVIVKNGEKVSTTVAALRGNVLFEAKSCSNLPHEYALPFVLHPVFRRVLGGDDYVKSVDVLHNGFTCGIGEDTVGVSMTILTVTGIGFIIFIWERLNKRKIPLRLGYDTRTVVVAISLLIIGAVALGLPPAKIAGDIPTPAYVLLKLTTTWRTLTRMYVLVNIGIITLFSIILLAARVYFSAHKKLLTAAFVLLFLGVFIEYMAFSPFKGNELSSFNYQRDVPPVYSWLKGQDSIRVIAEYPLEKAGGESNAMAYYLSMQMIHKKQLFNGNDPLSYEEELRNSLKDITDPHTLAVLSAVGVDTVVVHGVAESDLASVPGLEVVHVEPQAPFNILAYTPLVKKDNTVVARITAAPAAAMLRFDSGFARNATIIHSAADWEYEVLNNAKMSVVSFPGGPEITGQPTRQCFAIRLAAENDSGQITISADGENTQTVVASSSYMYVETMAGRSIVLTTSAGQNMRIKDLGCK